MLHTLTLIVVPSLGRDVDVRNVLVKREKFIAKPGTLATSKDGNSKAVLGVACADFHDVGVAVQNVSGMVEARMYLVDARQRLFRFRPQQNTLEHISMVFSYHESQDVPTMYDFFDFGGIRWAFTQPV